MIKHLILLNLLSFGYSNIIYPNENSELFIHNKYNITWEGNLTNYHIYLLHQNENPLFTSSLSTFENGDLVLDDVLTDNYYEWHIPRDLNYYDLEQHSFKIMIANNPMFSSSLSNTDNVFILSDSFNIITNMNITEPKKNYVVIPKQETKIIWNGFLGYVDIILEYDNNGWEFYKKLEDSYDTKDVNEYNWKVPIELNNLADYKFRIKLKEVETGILRLSEVFKSYGLELIEPKLLQYDFLTREDNQLNISWNEKNNIYGQNVEIRVLNQNDDKINIYNSNLSQKYCWELENQDYNKNYIVEIENYNITQNSETFLINHLTTTITSTTTTTSLTSTTSTTTISTTTISTTTISTTTISTTTNTETTISTTTNTETTISTTTISTTTNTETSSSSTTNTETSITISTITNTKTSSTLNTQTSTSNTITIDNLSKTTTYTEEPLIIIDKVP